MQRNNELRSMVSYKLFILLLKSTLEWSIEMDKNELAEEVFAKLDMFLADLNPPERESLSLRIIDDLRARSNDTIDTLENVGLSLDEVSVMAGILAEADESIKPEK